MTTLTTVRTFGIAAHVDAGKTTLAERILFYTGRIHALGETRGERPPTLDHDPQERDRGITIGAAATSCGWRDAELHIVDTPGHVDFTVEVERAMSALDGAVLVLDAVAGVQAQTRTVVRQMQRYAVPFLAFVNKCDRLGADPLAVVEQLRRRLGLDAVAVQLPVGLEADHRGVIDVVRRRQLTFVGDHGEQVVVEPVPVARHAEVEAARARLLDDVSLHDDAVLELLVSDGDVDDDLLVAALRRLTVAGVLVPVLVGAAYRNVGVQPLLDAVSDWLPGPQDRAVGATTPDGASVEVRGEEDAPVVARAFKVVETDHGPVTWLRVHRGRLAPGQSLADGRDGSVHRLRRLVRLHAGQSQPVSGAGAGEVVAAVGLALPTGTTLCDPEHPLVLGAVQLPEPVVERRLSLRSGSMEKLSRALGRMVREDPTLRVHTDPETGELRLTGMGELHLDVVARRLGEDHGLGVALGPPAVRGRQALGRAVPIDFTLRKQTGGPGLYAKLVGELVPSDDVEVLWEVTGGSVPSDYRKAVEAGFREALAHDAEPPVLGARLIVRDGDTHPNDSSDLAFQLCARFAVRDAIAKAAPILLEPIARVEVEADPAHHGTVLSSLLQRRGRVLESEVSAVGSRVEAEVPLVEMFGYSSTLRSATSGSGAYSVVFSHYGA